MRIAKRGLKKQSQFLKGQNNVNSVITKDYDKLAWFGRPKNKANSKPIKANTLANTGQALFTRHADNTAVLQGGKQATTCGDHAVEHGGTLQRRFRKLLPIGG